VQDAAAFKGAAAEETGEVLDRLAALGLLVTWLDAGVRQWRGGDPAGGLRGARPTPLPT